MAEYIEREKLAKAIKIWQNSLIETYGKNDEYVRCLDSVLRGIDNAPAADVRPVVRGEWLPFGKRGIYGMMYACSSCRAKYDGKTNFCPNCGADMREDKANGT